MSKPVLLGLALGLIFMSSFTGQCYGQLEVGFYKGKCGGKDVEAIVSSVIATKIKDDPKIVAALLRLQFHDCFVRGCDASILLDGSNSEKTAPINLHLRGFDIIDAAKAAVEAVCPGVVSCADIIVMATRDSVAKSKGVRYDVQTGRRDGFISLAQNTVDIPTPNISVSDSIKAFDKKGLGFVDMVYLLGAHTVGVAHCSAFIDRLYNFKNTGKPDPSMNDELLTKLRSTCPQNATVDNIANLDQNPRTSIIVDNSYYYQILKHRGVLQIDQELVYDLRTVLVVLGATLELDFNIRFPHAMVNLGKVQVLTGTEGEIRKSCPAVNNPTAMAI
ncbi:peroxidase 60-like [Camellia sinensis]|uniref:peroxidase 60-like n=1 Tax=Camellia sinensis TaxID=4442 RepID=UPI001036758E|nr:peroxidase 60-like [Camellia sinensis]